MNNQVEIFARSASDMEESIRKTVNELHTQSVNRKAYIQYQKKVVIKPITYSDNDIFSRAIRMGMKVLNITSRSATLQALSQSAYYNASKF